MHEFKPGDTVIVRQFLYTAPIPQWALELSYGTVVSMNERYAVVEILEELFEAPSSCLEPMFKVGEGVFVTGDEESLASWNVPSTARGAYGTIIALDCDDGDDVLVCYVQLERDNLPYKLWFGVNGLSRTPDILPNFSADDFEALLGG